MLMDQQPFNRYHLQWIKPSFTKQNLISLWKRFAQNEMNIGRGERDDIYVPTVGLKISFSPVEFDGT